MIKIFLLTLIFPLFKAEDLVHNPIQYHSQNPRGSYNYGYDTGLYGSHQFHQENKDNHGVVRGRYGYTDPDGKLRLTYYTAGPDGYNVIKDSTPAERTPVETVAIATPVVHTRTHHHAPIVVTSPCKYRNPPCHQARVHQEPEKVNTYSEKSTHHENKVTTEYRSHPPAPVAHAQSTPQEHNHHHLHHRNHDAHTQTTPIASTPIVHTTPVHHHPPAPVTVRHHDDIVNTHSKTITKTVIDTPIQSHIVHQAPIVVKAPPPIIQAPIAIKTHSPPPPPAIIQAPIAIKAPAPVIQQVVHQEQSKIHRSPVQVYRGKVAVPPRKYEEYAKGRYVPNYKPSSPYSRCWCE